MVGAAEETDAMDDILELVKVVASLVEELGTETKRLGDAVRCESAALDRLGQVFEGSGARVDGLGAEVQGLKAEVQCLKEDLAGFRRETGEKLTKIQYRLGYFAEKYLEHDQEIYQLKRKQA